MKKILLLLLVCLLGSLSAAVPAISAAQDAPLVRDFVIGFSAQGRPIEVVQVGNGERKLVVVGDTHGGPEANTYRLTLELIDHFRAAPQEVPPDVRLYLIPTINPDGLALGSRFDAFGVDLNRNMNTNLDSCPDNDWSRTVFGAYGVVSNTGGAYPDSQTESRIIRSFLLDASGAIFLHSNAGLVFPASCEHAPSIQMAQLYAEAADYVYMRYWPNYLITGGMHDWAGSLGIAAITPELVSPVATEFSQNLAGLQAVLEQREAVLPLPQDRTENDIVVPALIWRYWRAHGGEAVFGLPIEPAASTPRGKVQTFSRARLELDLELADTPYLVQPMLLGSKQLGTGSTASNYNTTTPDNQSEWAQADYISQPVPPGTPAVHFEETGYSLSEAFLDYWQRYGGVEVFGYPISGEFTAYTADGQQRIVQYFERAQFAYYPEDGSVRPEPLGWRELLRDGVQSTTLRHQLR
jgi:predicted deacylase